MRGVKRKRNVEHKNGNGEYPSENCDFQTTYSGSLRKHIEVIHKGVCYSFNQCDYKATQKITLRQHVENKGICYSINVTIEKLQKQI